MAIELGYHTAGAVLGALSALVALALAIVVVKAGRSKLNRRLALLLAADAMFTFTNFGSVLLTSPDPASPWRVLIGAFVLFDALALLAFVGMLDSPMGRALGKTGGTVAILALGVIATAGTLAGLARGRSILGFGNIEAPDWFTLVGVSLVALVVSIDAYRRTPRGTVAHRRAAWAALAFITRDAITAVFILGWGVAAVLGSEAGKGVAEALGGLMIMVFCGLLTYGILRTQLYDIDLRVRWGIQKGTIVGIIVAVAFVGEKLAEQILSREFGWVIGSILAGLLVFAAPRLNRLGDKVASTAMPKVEATPAYLAHKKLEVYKAAVESALEDDGVIDARERAMLDRLRSKLALPEGDCAMVEAELAVPSRAASTSAAST